MYPLLIGGLALAALKLIDNAERSANVLHGYEREQAVARYLQRLGARVQVSAGSRGAADVHADWPRTRWRVQVKSSRAGIPRAPGPEDRVRLLRVSRTQGARPVIALCEGKRTTYVCAVTGSRIYPPKRPASSKK